MNRKTADSITGIVSILAVAVFVLLGFLLNTWHPTWLVFLAVPLTRLILGMFIKKDQGEVKGTDTK